MQPFLFQYIDLKMSSEFQNLPTTSSVVFRAGRDD